MAAKNNEIYDYPETITIIAEPSFGTAIKLLLFGAAIGAGAVLYLRKPGATVAPAAPPATPNDRRASDREVSERVQTLAKNVKILAGRARDAAQLASKAVTPAIKNAVAEGRRAAMETTSAIEADLETEPDTKYAEEGEKIEAERAAEAARRGF